MKITDRPDERIKQDKNFIICKVDRLSKKKMDRKDEKDKKQDKKQYQIFICREYVYLQKCLV